MAAGSWFDWTTGDLVTEAKFQDIQDSIVFIYASDAAANSALTNKTEGTVYFNTTDDKLKFWDGSAWVELSGVDVFELEFLIIGGGGAGGWSSTSAVEASGGGGAGGYLCKFASETSGGGSVTLNSFYVIPSTNYPVTIGAGGTGATDTFNSSNDGFPSYVGSLYAFGGGGGAKQYPAARRGGSGGGGGPRYSPDGGSNGDGGSAVYGQGSNGGNWTGTAAVAPNAGGGGGGAGATGSNGSSGAGGAGGNGKASSITGSSVTRAGGGGGAGTSSAGAGGSGGGGAGSRGGTPSSGTANTGGGGGGASNTAAAGASGGSGLVILRYPDTYTITVGAGLTSSTSTSGGFSVTEITAGTDTVSWS